MLPSRTGGIHDEGKLMWFKRKEHDVALGDGLISINGHYVIDGTFYRNPTLTP